MPINIKNNFPTMVQISMKTKKYTKAKDRLVRKKMRTGPAVKD